MVERYNIAPTQEIPAVTESRDGHRKFRLFRWGLVPHWAQSLKIGSQMINAKAETLSERPAFKVAFERRRCLIPADGFFEWKDVPLEEPQASLFGDAPAKSGKIRKQPYHFTLKNDDVFAFAGLWSRWSDTEGHIVDSCAIITTPANELIAPIHDRMPAIIAPEDFGKWLDREVQNPSELQYLLSPFPADKMNAIPVKSTSEYCIDVY